MTHLRWLKIPNQVMGSWRPQGGDRSRHGLHGERCLLCSLCGIGPPCTSCCGLFFHCVVGGSDQHTPLMLACCWSCTCTCRSLYSMVRWGLIKNKIHCQKWLSHLSCELLSVLVWMQHHEPEILHQKPSINHNDNNCHHQEPPVIDLHPAVLFVNSNFDYITWLRWNFHNVSDKIIKRL